MVSNQKTQRLLTEYIIRYPRAEIADVFKFLHQSVFGCEHMVASLEAATQNIKQESAVLSCSETAVEQLDGEYCRVPLSMLCNGLSTETFAKLFFLSAQKAKASVAELEEKLKTASGMAERGELPFDKNEFDEAANKWKLNGYKALHHSDAFRTAYKPSYRVISNCFVPFLPLFSAVDRALEKGRVVLAVEGKSASGKTTLAKALEDTYGCTVFHTDDFFLQPHQRTPGRYAEVGGNLDRERFFEEIILPLKANKPINYQRFDCGTMRLLPAQAVELQKLVVVEGAYSMHPYFGEYYDLSVFLDVEPELQKERILKRNCEIAERFFKEWIPLENRYFTQANIRQRCNINLAAL